MSEQDPYNHFAKQWNASQPVSASTAEPPRRMLTAEEIIEIEQFQKQRRKHPVPQDAWLYVAEIDRLLAHIRLEREQIGNEIFQDITE